jgi:hypothetical protein
MTENSSDSFNIQPLVFEIENLIKNGLKVILKNYTDRYNLLEKTHQQIMKLPSVMNEINKNYESEAVLESVSECKDSISFDNISVMTRELIKNEILHVESKLDRIEKKYESISPLISKILDKLESINDEVKVLKENSIDNIKTESEKPYISNIIKPSLVSSCENENIKFEINDTEDEEVSVVEEIVEQIVIKDVVTEINVSDKAELDEEEVVEAEASEEEVAEEEASEEEVVEEEAAEASEAEASEEEASEEVVEEEVSEAEEEVEVEASEEEVEVEASEEEVETEASDEEAVETEASDEEEATEIDTTNCPTKVEETEEEELSIITIDDVDYCTNDEENGFIWALSEEGEQGDKIGYLKDGEPFFYADEK